MRTIALILLLFPVYVCLSQETAPKYISLDEAIKDALNYNPGCQNDSIARERISELKKNWFGWLYSINKSSILQEYRNSLNDLERITGIRYENGDIDLFESASKMNMLADIDSRLSVCINQILLHQNVIRQLIYCQDEIQPSDTALELYELDKSSALTGNRLSGSTDYERFVNDLELENRHLELDNLFIRLRYFRSVALNYAGIIINTATARLNAEEIDYMEYVDMIKEAFEIRIDHLNMLNLYNQCAIQLEYYAY